MGTRPRNLHFKSLENHHCHGTDPWSLVALGSNPSSASYQVYDLRTPELFFFWSVTWENNSKKYLRGLLGDNEGGKAGKVLGTLQVLQE